MGTYFELDQRLTRFRKHRANGAGKHGAQPLPNLQKAPASNGTKSAGKAKAKAAWYSTRAFNAPVSYRVPGIVPPERQPTSMTCWATVATMMLEWRDNQSMSIDRAIGGIGPDWLAKFTANQGLSATDKGAFLAAAGLVAEPPMSYSVEGWLQLLRSYGPLWVTTDEDPSANFSIHARIIVSMEGDGTPDGTKFRIVDPATATEYSETVSTFMQKFESEALDPNRPLRIQVVHWQPASAQAAAGAAQSDSGTAKTQSYSARAYRRPSRAFDASADALAWGAKVSPDFRDGVRQIGGRLGCDPNHLMAAIAFETGESFSPSIRNQASGATGLIQFMPRTAKGLGTTTDELAQMTPVQQLDYVERYLRPYSGRLSTIEDVYMAILWPRAVGQANSVVLFSQPSQAYKLNRGLDADSDGSITKEEAASPVRRKLAKGQQSANAA